ncbi:nuclear transport factor 2 family protein [Nocardioides zeae]|uniref:Nuclear transport factor 2 family protein n=1 Tax=Nocardioides imazamoxiresistens TaxID=3231893 RepID=A0ABU3PSC2_9ACTN|nr:nuclear transport factor 2 family protein [Nocardioides zeae]MDT9592127.1 nuclear transport factor 2 family protein [Nocardioides zeae]
MSAAGGARAVGDEVVSRLVDRAAIEDVVRRYAVGLDERRWELWEGVFTDDAVIDFTPMGGRKETPAEMRARLGAPDPEWLFAQHPVSNTVVEIDGDRAKAWSEYGVETGRRTATPGELRRMSGGGSYVDRLVRTGAGWRIAERRVSMKWKRTETTTDEVDRARQGT